MSALVLISHTKQGMEMAEQHHLGKEVTDIIRQHHGTGLIRYFL
jgi:membrane-associated HD superfamily phosphohydrolase